MPTFVTIPAVGTFVTFPIFSGPLLALALVYFLAARAWTGTCGEVPHLRMSAKSAVVPHRF